MNWDLEIEKLCKYIFEDNLSYEEIGRIYNCSGNNIKKLYPKEELSCQFVLKTKIKNLIIKVPLKNITV